MIPVLIVITMLSMISMVNGMTTHFLYWNSTNPQFGTEAEHILEVNRGNNLLEHDQLHLICPNSGEQHVIYAVSEAEYRMCRVTDPRPKIVAVCNQAQGKFRYFTITFRSFSPNPTAMEFKPGQSYYLISTSTQRDLHRRAGGYCATHNMKMVINVAEATENNNNVDSDISNEVASINRPVIPEVNQETFHIKRVTTERVTPAANNVPVYYYRAKAQNSRASDYIYYYSPRDIIQLRLKAKKHAKGVYNKKENETFYKAARLTANSSSTISSSLAVVLLSAVVMFLKH